VCILEASCHQQVTAVGKGIAPIANLRGTFVQNLLGYSKIAELNHAILAVTQQVDGGESIAMLKQAFDLSKRVLP
jgi:hypothetical protein